MSFDVDIKLEQSNFLELMFKDQVAKVVIATRWGPTKDDFGRKFFMWPRQQEDILSYIQVSMMESREIFFSPDMYFEEARSYYREHVFGSYWIAADSDGNAPSTDRWENDELYKDTPKPTAVIQSSTSKNKHFYWEIPWTTDIQLLQDMRRYVIHNLDADSSGWDAGQLLRVPYTMNYGYAKSRTEVYEVFPEEINSDRRYTVADFPAPTNFSRIVEADIDTDHLKNPTEIFALNEFDKDLITAYLRPAIENDRSGALSHLAFMLAESNSNRLSNEDMYSILYAADERWGKYKSRADQKKQLSRLIARARRKHPFASDNEMPSWGLPEEIEDGKSPILSYREFMAQKIEQEFIYQDLLTTTGVGLFTGPSNIGKTQISLQFCKSAAMGKPIFNGIDHWKNIVGSVNTMLLSLEMDAGGIQYFLGFMKAKDTPEDETLLDQNFHIMTPRRTMYLDEATPKNNHERLNMATLIITQILIENKIKLLVIDSLWKITKGDTGKEETIKALSEKLVKMRYQCKCALVIVHHLKKKQLAKRYEGDVDDVMGSAYIVNDADFVLMFLPSETKEKLNEIRVIPAKIRLGKKPSPFIIQRNENLGFDYVDEGGGLDGPLNDYLTRFNSQANPE